MAYHINIFYVTNCETCGCMLIETYNGWFCSECGIFWDIE